MFSLDRCPEFSCSHVVLRIGNHVFICKVSDRCLTNQSAPSMSVILQDIINNAAFKPNSQFLSQVC